MDMWFDLYFYFKFTDIEGMEEVMDYVKEFLKVKINEEEIILSDETVDTDHWRSSYSSDIYDSNTLAQKDILKLKRRFKGPHKIYAKYRDFIDFPFDMPLFNFRLELSHFELEVNGKMETYRFDFYRRWIKEVNWNPSSCKLSEFDIDFNSCKIVTLIEHKPYGENDELKSFYYPGLVLQL